MFPVRFSAKSLTFVLSLLLLSSIAQAEADEAILLEGAISKNHQTEVVSYALNLGTTNLRYQVSGRTTPQKGYVATTINFDSAKVLKWENNIYGRVFQERFTTRGEMDVYPRKRFLNGVTLAGVPASGYFIQGAVNDGIFMDYLEIDGIKAKGLLDYNNFVGYYRAKRDAHFGDVEIKSSMPNSNVFINYDNYIGQNRMKVTMVFNDLLITGTIFFDDHSVTTTDLDGDADTDVVGTAAKFSLQLQHVDGKPVQMSRVGEKATADDVTMRKLIAFWMLFSYDMLSE